MNVRARSLFLVFTFQVSTRALRKVYREQSIEFRIHIAEHLRSLTLLLHL
jgi:hypothetical protein